LKKSLIPLSPAEVALVKPLFLAESASIHRDLP